MKSFNSFLIQCYKKSIPFNPDKVRAYIQKLECKRHQMPSLIFDLQQLKHEDMDLGILHMMYDWELSTQQILNIMRKIIWHSLINNIVTAKTIASNRFIEISLISIMALFPSFVKTPIVMKKMAISINHKTLSIMLEMILDSVLNCSIHFIYLFLIYPYT